MLGLSATVAAAPTAVAVPASPVPVAAGGKTKVYLTLEEALGLAFPAEAKVERGTVYLTKGQRKRVEKLAGSKLLRGVVHPYVATDAAGELIGTAYVDTHRVRTLRETLMVVVDPQGRVKRIELLAFAEPEDYLPRGKWYGQFLGKKLDDDLNVKRGIRGITGATLTAGATTAAVRRSLALDAVLRSTPPTEPAR